MAKKKRPTDISQPAKFITDEATKEPQPIPEPKPVQNFGTLGTLFHSMHNYDLSPSSIRATALLTEDVFTPTYRAISHSRSAEFPHTPECNGCPCLADFVPPAA